MSSTPDVAICVPWRASTPTRNYIWSATVKPHLDSLPWPVFTGNSDPFKPFNRAAARNRAADRAGKRDAYIFCDADHVVAEDLFAEAIEYALESGMAVHPYDKVRVYQPDGRSWPTEFSQSHTSGTIVIPREMWLATGGWDERFEKWGWEDVAMSNLMKWLGGGLGRIDGYAMAFDHERGPNEYQTGTLVPPPLAQEYMDLRSADDARALVAARATIGVNGRP